MKLIFRNIAKEIGSSKKIIILLLRKNRYYIISNI